jgi:membrane-bound serine protease (ClpP class)
MVSLRVEVWRVKNLESDKFEFFETDKLPKDANAYDLRHKELIDKDDELLTLTATQALEYGIARATVKDRQGVLDFLAERDGVSFTGQPSVLETNWSEEMVRWVNSPAVISALFMLALLGVYIELNTPGVGLPGLVAVICFAIIFGSKYLVGMANWVEIVVFATGILLLFVEIFVLPGFGIAGTVGIICILVGLFGILIGNAPDEVPWPKTDFDWELFINGALALLFGFTGFVLAAWLLAKYLPRMQLFSGLLLAPAAAKQGDEIEISMTAPPRDEVSSIKIGDIGEVLSPLRPSGMARFGDAIVDVVARGEFLQKGNKVEIVEIHGNRVVVKAVED